MNFTPKTLITLNFLANPLSNNVSKQNTMKNDIPQKCIMRNIYSNLNIKGLSKEQSKKDLITLT